MEKEVTTWRLRPDVFLAGQNVIAAEVHQYAINSDDLWFELELVGQTTENPAFVLNPGVNQIVVDYLDSAGNVIETDVEDVFYDTGSYTTFQGFNQGPIRMTAAGGPYRMTNDSTFSGGLVIEPGATLFCDDFFTLRVRIGELYARGFREGRIWIGPTPGLATSAPILESDIGTYLDFVDYQGGGTGFATAGFTLKDFLIARNSYFTGRRDDLFVMTDTSVLFRNNLVDAQFGDPPVDPQPDREYFEGIGDIGDYMVIEDNVFNLIAAKSDMIDTISGELPGPIMEVRGNEFYGGSDEVVDGNGDYLLDGNFVLNVNNPSPSFSSNSNFISTEGNFRHYAITRNVIVNCQHIVNNVNNTFVYLENNTIYNVLTDPNSESSPVTMRLGNSTPGLGAYLAGNIWDTLPTFVFGRPDNGQPMFIEVHNDMTQDAAWFDNVLTHNVDFVIGDPDFVNIAENDFRLVSTSDGQNSGPFGNDHGAFVPRAVRLLGAPTGVSNSDTATITVGGPGMFEFIYRLDDGPWSDPIQIQDPMDTQNESKQRTYDLEITGLSNGAHQVFFRGIDMAGDLQPSISATNVWQVQLGGTASLNEVRTPGRGEPGFIELWNQGTEAFELRGHYLARSSERPLHAFGDSDRLNAGAYLDVSLELSPDGDRVGLYDADGELVDEVRFGHQSAGLSLARRHVEGDWLAALPTPGAPNVEANVLAEPSLVRISEWLIDGPDGGFVELYNPTAYPVALADLILSGSVTGAARRHRLRRLQLPRSVRAAGRPGRRAGAEPRGRRAGPLRAAARDGGDRRGLLRPPAARHLRGPHGQRLRELLDSDARRAARGGRARRRGLPLLTPPIASPGGRARARRALRPLPPRAPFQRSPSSP